MERVNTILMHPLYVSNREQMTQLETNRIFCRHGLEHSLDVARILYIKVLEQQLDIRKDVIYAVALLHDIGRVEEYTKGIPHQEGGLQTASRILESCGYDRKEIELILQAIQCHKGETPAETDVLCKLLYEADKLSRNCFQCDAVKQCYWNEDKKNKGIQY